MCKSLMTLHVLELINTSLKEVRKRSEKINDADDFLISESGVILLDSICMTVLRKMETSITLWHQKKVV